MNRRELLIGAGAAVATAALPVPVPIPIDIKINLVWAVGTPGEWNWQVVKAATEAEAKLTWIVEAFGIDECEHVNCGDDKCLHAGTDAECDCDFCHNMRDLDADRKPEWDGKNVSAGDATWFASGLDAYCGRCGYETSHDQCGHVVNGDIVCEDCMKLEDYDVVDPEQAAEMRAEAAEP